MKDVVAYVRVSTTRQGEHGVSLPQQRDAIAQYAQVHGLRIIEWFEEQQSASKRGRPVFRRMLDMLSQRKTVGVVVHKIDRSTRNMTEWAAIDELPDRGIDVFFANDGLDLRVRSNRLSAGIQAVVASDYSRNLREEARKGFYGRLKQGVYPGPAPLGYANVGRGQPKTIGPMAGLVRDAFELYASGNHSLRMLVQEMADRGLRNKHGRSLRMSEMHRLLHNPFYIGLMRIRKTGEVFEGKHPPLISKSLFQRVQDLMEGRTARPVRQHDFLFRRLLRCGRCKRLLIGERQKGHVYYRCHNVACPKVSIREEVVEQELLDVLTLLKFSDDDRARVDVELQRLERELIEREDEIRKGLALRRSQITARLDRLTDAYLDALIDKETFESRKTTLLVERRGVEEQLQPVESESRTELLAETLELANNAYLLYRSASLAEKRELIELVSSNREVHGKTPVFTLVPAFADLVDRSNYPNGAPSRNSNRTFATSRRSMSKRKWRKFLRRLIVTIGVEGNPIPEYFKRPLSVAA